jgi:uncharacterized protein YbjT (DUF2867 family)
MFVVTGATGNTGSVVAATLLDAGKEVTVVVRSAKKADPWKARGARVVEADLRDTRVLASAFRGASGAYLMLPPAFDAVDYQAERAAIAQAYAAAAAEAHLPHAVFLSSFGAQHASGTGAILTLRAAETALARIPVLTALRPSWFFENFLPALPAAQSEGVLNGFINPRVVVPMIATRDIGAVAAELLLHPPSQAGVVEITGPEDHTMEDIAAVLSEVFSRPVRYQAAPPEAAIGIFAHMGMTQDAARVMAELFDGVNKGLTAPVGTPRRMGISAREFFSTHAAKTAAQAG